MSKHNRLKKALTGIVSAAMLASSMTITGTAPSVSAASGHNYAEALELGLYFFDANQCGTEVDDNCLTWRGNCHTYDAEAPLSNAKGLSSEASSVIQEQSGGSTVDVSGGYHDAGDHVKFNTTMSFNATSLNWSYYDYPEAYKETGTEGHLFYIIRETADYLMKTTYRNNNGDVVAICQTVSDNSDHGYWSAPETQTYNRPTYWLSSSAGNPVISYQMVAALASTAVTFQSTDPDYAAKCLDYADAIYKFGQKYPGNETGGIGSMYGLNSDPDDDKCWAELWLHLADSSAYSLPSVKPNANLDGGYTTGDYDCWVYCWDKVWGGYASLMYRVTGDSLFGGEVKGEMDRLVNSYGYNSAYYPISGWGTSRYNCAWQKYALTYGEVSGNDEYIEYARKQMNYILGDNPTGYSFLIGYGDKNPVRIHHRAANPGENGKTSADNISCKYTLYGALIGGPTSVNGDYEDHSDRYEYTEPALDYNACFMLAITGLYANYGGDTSAADNKIAGASEIDNNFDFGGEVVTPVETGTATISVIDTDTGEYLPNAELELYASSTSSNAAGIPSARLIGTWNTSDKNPASFTDLTIEDATYEIMYTDIPSYVIDKDASVLSFTFDESSSVEITIGFKKEEVTTTTTTTTSTTTTTTTTAPPDDIVYGDADEDGNVGIADVVLVMSYSGNKSAYTISEKGLDNADVYQRGDGVGASDALSIQKFIAQVLLELPESVL